MKKIGLILLLLVSGPAWAAGGGGDLEHAGINISDTSSLQRGAAVFRDYCFGCHAADYMRYQRLADDLELGEDYVKQYFMRGDTKIGDTMSIAMDAADSEVWFGKTPPDLSLIARSRTPDWLYAYLRSFYRDENGAWNNTIFPDVSMPNVFWQEQGILEPVYDHAEDHGEGEAPQIAHLEPVQAGSMTPEAFDGMVRDLVAFLEYMGEPAKLKRKSVGWKVLLFLALFAFLAYLLKAEYWRDIH